MTIAGELKNLGNVQSRCIRFSKYLEKHHPGEHEELCKRLPCVVGTIEDVLEYKI